MITETKDQRYVEAGKRGARLRWGPRRVVRLDELDPDTARLIRALLSAAEDEQQKASTDG